MFCHSLDVILTGGRGECWAVPAEQFQPKYLSEPDQQTALHTLQQLQAALPHTSAVFTDEAPAMADDPPVCAQQRLRLVAL